LFEVDASGVLAVEFEGYAPWAVHMNGVADRAETAKRMEVETGQVHVFRAFGNFKTVEPGQDSLVHHGVDPAGFPALEQLRKSLASEGPDHEFM
jgi:hypothetical protein